jgi:hypothetical protein
MDDQAYVARLYLAILGHSVNMTDLATYGGALDQKSLTRSQVVQLLFTSTEFLSRAL